MDELLPRDWPAGSGEMADRVRAHDWSTTSLGLVERTLPREPDARTRIGLRPDGLAWRTGAPVDAGPSDAAGRHGVVQA